MFVFKSLLAVPYGTIFTGLPEPLSSFGVPSSFAATIPADKASPQYGRIARIAGTVFAVGSVSYGVARLAALASRPEDRHIAKVPFKHADVSFNPTAVYGIPPCPALHKFSFAAAYEASLSTSLAVVNSDLLQPSLILIDQSGSLAGSEGIFNKNQALYQSPEAASVSDTAIDNVNSAIVLPVASPTSDIRGSPSNPLQPSITSGFGNKNKVPGTFLDFKYFLFAFAFFVGLYIGARPFNVSTRISDDKETKESLDLYFSSSFIPIDLSEEEEDLESWIHNDDLFTLPYIAYAFWEMMPITSNANGSFTHKLDIASSSSLKGDSDNLTIMPSVSPFSSSVSQQQCEEGEVIIIQEPRAEANLPQLMFATVFVPAIIICLQAIAPSKESASGADESVNLVNNDMAAEQEQGTVVEEGNGDTPQGRKEEEETEWEDGVFVAEVKVVEVIQSEPSPKAAVDGKPCDLNVCLFDNKLPLSCTSLPSISPNAERPLNTEVDIKATVQDPSPSPSGSAPALNANAPVFVPRRPACPLAAEPIQVFVGSTPYRPPRGARRAHPGF